MRCLSCNQILSDHEQIFKDKDTGQYVDLCNECLTQSARTAYNYEVDSGIDDFTVYCMDNLTEPDWPTYERAPYWLHKIIEKSELLYEHDEDIVNNCADGDY